MNFQTATIKNTIRIKDQNTFSINPYPQLEHQRSMPKRVSHQLKDFLTLYKPGTINLMETRVNENRAKQITGSFEFPNFISLNVFGEIHGYKE